MDDFTTIRLKRNVIRRFKEYSKKTSPSYSETLDFMIAFFEDTGLSPYDIMNNPILSSTIAINKRTEAVVTILRNIEKTQLIPTREMLESLFEQQLDQGDDDDYLSEHIEFIEKKFEHVERGEEFMEETTVPKIRYERLQEKMEKLKADFGYVLEKAKPVKPVLGNPYVKLELNPEELEKYRRIIENL